MVGWGSTYGAIAGATRRARAAGKRVSHLHLRHLNPFPANLEAVLRRFDKVLVPEINLGQLRTLIRSQFLVDAIGINQVTGRMFQVGDLVKKTEEIIKR